MLLIFGAGFQLSQSAPVVRLKFLKDNIYKFIKQPQLIWWNENLLECQLPECNQDVEISVSNFEHMFGEGRSIQIDATESSNNTNSEMAEANKLSNQILISQNCFDFQKLPMLDQNNCITFSLHLFVRNCDYITFLLPSPSKSCKILVSQFSLPTPPFEVEARIADAKNNVLSVHTTVPFQLQKNNQFQNWQIDANFVSIKSISQQPVLNLEILFKVPNNDNKTFSFVLDPNTNKPICLQRPITSRKKKKNFFEALYSQKKKTQKKKNKIFFSSLE